MYEVDLPERSVDDFEPLVGREEISRLRALAAPLRGVRIVHINATSVGGGVAEILTSEIPLLRSLNLDAHWLTIRGEPTFFESTKAIHNGLQGHPVADAAIDWTVYDRWQTINARDLDRSTLIIIHDPQPIGLAAHAAGRADVWVWRSHIDTTEPNPRVWSRIAEELKHYDASVFTLDTFVNGDLNRVSVKIMPPAIDPLSVKNRQLSFHRGVDILRRIGIDPTRPLVSQVARLDRWKDPWGVIDAFRIIRENIPGLQLALLGVIAAKDDPEAHGVYQSVRTYAACDPDIHIYVSPEIIGQLEVNAVQTMSQVVFQKSIREGFGLTVSEALWKATPVIGGRTGGIPLQIVDGVNGYLVESAEEAAAKALSVLGSLPRARVMGTAGREWVRKQFLITRLIADELELYHELLGQSP